MRTNILTIFLGYLIFVEIKANPRHLVLTTTEKYQPSKVEQLTSLEAQADSSSFDDNLIISRFHVTSNIQFRYAHTQVASYVKNPSSKAREISFTAVIPDSGFISNFSMVLRGREYVAAVRNKEDAQKKYHEAVAEGKSAGLVSEDFRNSNKFIVAANVEAGDKVEFKVTYEELLERKLGQYEYVINVNPGQVVEDFRIEVLINESLPIKSLIIPKLKESNEIDLGENQESDIAKVQRNVDGEASKAKITFSPDKLYQEESGLQGLSGQFVVQYDVDRSGQDNEIQVVDGYFVHFFTPENLPTLPKHVIFVLDISGSMEGEKMNQLKDAMFTILDDMTESDYFNIILFNSGVYQWDDELKNFTILVKNAWHRKDVVSDTAMDGEVFIIEATRKKKEDFIDKIIALPAEGGTNMNAGLLEGLKIAQISKSSIQNNEILPEDIQPIIVFLSDGQPTEGIKNPNEIKENIREANPFNIPIYSLGFGEEADFNLLKNISTTSGAFSKQIYEGSDAAFQLEKFFAEISSPLLSNVKFNYVGGLVDNSSVSDSEIQTFFKGGEFVVTGKLMENKQNDIIEKLNVTVTGDGRNGTHFERNLKICLSPGPCTLNPLPPLRSQAQNFLQKLHAFINIKQLLKKNDEYVDLLKIVHPVLQRFYHPREKARRLALENNFVTELTSLIVVRPDKEPEINKLVVENNDYDLSSFPSYFSASYFVYDEDYDDYEENFIEGVGVVDVTEETDATLKGSPCTGNITLFSKTYLRGENVTYTEDTKELTDFDNKLVSVEVKGDCCWTLFTDVGYEGHSQAFGEGKYTSLVQVKNVFRKASSLRKVECI